MTGTVIRRVTPDDVEAIVTMVIELAEYERSAHEARMTVDQLHAALFGPEPALFGHIAVRPSADPAVRPSADPAVDEPVGFALWFLNFSTWEGAHGIYLEDLYVRPAARGTGTGKELLRVLAELCVQRGYTRLQWWVLDWNRPAIDFYLAAGAVAMEEWTVYRVGGSALTDLAASGTRPSPRG